MWTVSVIYQNRYVSVCLVIYQNRGTGENVKGLETTPTLSDTTFHKTFELYNINKSLQIKEKMVKFLSIR